MLFPKKEEIISDAPRHREFLIFGVNVNYNTEGGGRKAVLASEHTAGRGLNQGFKFSEPSLA